MRAVRFYDRGDIRVDQIDEPVCGDGQVKVRPAFVGICGSDLHEYIAGPMNTPQAPHPITGGKIPVTLGHEFSGTIEEVGAGVTRVKVGDLVAVKPNLSDGTCPCCLAGKTHCCRNLGFIGFSSNTGGLSDHIVVGEKHAILLPDTFPLDIGALVEPLTIAWHAVNRSPVKPTDTVLIVGGGPIGLALIQVLKARGVESIVVAEVSPRRQEYAKTMGASEVIDPRSEDVVAKVRAMTNDAGAHVSFECSGVQAGFNTALNGIRVRGTLVIVSLWEEPPKIDATDLLMREKHVTGSAICEDGDFEAVIEAIHSGKLNPRTMITSKIRMEDVVEKGFKALRDERDKHVKILIDISA